MHRSRCRLPCRWQIDLISASEQEFFEFLTVLKLGPTPCSKWSKNSEYGADNMHRHDLNQLKSRHESSLKNILLFIHYTIADCLFLLQWPNSVWRINFISLLLFLSTCTCRPYLFQWLYNWHSLQSTSHSKTKISHRKHKHTVRSET